MVPVLLESLGRKRCCVAEKSERTLVRIVADGVAPYCLGLVSKRDRQHGVESGRCGADLQTLRKCIMYSNVSDGRRLPKA